MTIRDHIARRVAIGYGLAFAGFGLILVLSFVYDGGPGYAFGFASIPFFATIAYMNLGIRCPRCKGNLAITPAIYPTFSRKHRFNYCPYCGVDIDENL